MVLSSTSKDAYPYLVQRARGLVRRRDGQALLLHEGSQCLSQCFVPRLSGMCQRIAAEGIGGLKLRAALGQGPRDRCVAISRRVQEGRHAGVPLLGVDVNDTTLAQQELDHRLAVALARQQQGRAAAAIPVVDFRLVERGIRASIA